MPRSSSTRVIRPLACPALSSNPAPAAVPRPKPVPSVRPASDPAPPPKPLPLPSPNPWPYAKPLPSSKRAPDPARPPKSLACWKSAPGRATRPDSPPSGDSYSMISSPPRSLSSTSRKSSSPGCVVARHAEGEIPTKRTIDRRAARRNTTRLAAIPVEGANAPAGSETTASMLYSDTSAFLTCRSEPSRNSDPSGNATTALPPDEDSPSRAEETESPELRVGN